MATTIKSVNEQIDALLKKNPARKTARTTKLVAQNPTVSIAPLKYLISSKGGGLVCGAVTEDIAKTLAQFLADKTKTAYEIKKIK